MTKEDDFFTRMIVLLSSLPNLSQILFGELQVALSDLPHHRTYRSVYGGSNNVAKVSRTWQLSQLALLWCTP